MAEAKHDIRRAVRMKARVFAEQMNKIGPHDPNRAVPGQDRGHEIARRLQSRFSGECPAEVARHSAGSPIAATTGAGLELPKNPQPVSRRDVTMAPIAATMISCKFP